MVIKITILEVLEPFLPQPREPLHLADIARKSKMPHPTVRQHLNRLEKEGILEKRHKGRLTLYSLRLENNITDALVIAEKGRLIRKCDEHVLLSKLVRHLQERYSGYPTLIFGSATQEFIKANDIDILIIGTEHTDEINTLAKTYNIKIHLMTSQTLGEITEVMRSEIIKKHLIVNCSEQMVRWLYWSDSSGAKDRKEG